MLWPASVILSYHSSDWKRKNITFCYDYQQHPRLVFFLITSPYWRFCSWSIGYNLGFPQIHLYKQLILRNTWPCVPCTQNSYILTSNSNFAEINQIIWNVSNQLMFGVCANALVDVYYRYCRFRVPNKPKYVYHCYSIYLINNAILYFLYTDAYHYPTTGILTLPWKSQPI